MSYSKCNKCSLNCVYLWSTNPSSFLLKVQISKAEKDVYAAIIDEKVAMKIGPGHFEPPSDSQKWSLAIEGKDYKIWEAS